MPKTILLAALLGVLALFAWESVAHMVTGLGEAGVHAARLVACRARSTGMPFPNPLWHFWSLDMPGRSSGAGKM